MERNSNRTCTNVISKGIWLLVCSICMSKVCRLYWLVIQLVGFALKVATTASRKDCNVQRNCLGVIDIVEFSIESLGYIKVSFRSLLGTLVKYRRGSAKMKSFLQTEKTVRRTEGSHFHWRITDVSNPVTSEKNQADALVQQLHHRCTTCKPSFWTVDSWTNGSFLRRRQWKVKNSIEIQEGNLCRHTWNKQTPHWKVTLALFYCLFWYLFSLDDPDLSKWTLLCCTANWDYSDCCVLSENLWNISLISLSFKM